MMDNDVIVELRLEVLGKDQVIVPGCEPTSEVTSDTLLRFHYCCGATVSIDKILEAIPGSRIEFKINNGLFAGYRQKWLVLPGIPQNCDCTPKPDYYQIIKNLACEKDPVEPELDGDCAPIDMGFCPPSNYDEILPPPVSPYAPEGGSPYGDVADFIHEWPYQVNLA